MTAVLLIVALATPPASAGAQSSATPATEPTEGPPQRAAEPPRERNVDGESSASEDRPSAARESRTAAEAGSESAGVAEARAGGHAGAEGEEDEEDEGRDPQPDRLSTLGWNDDRVLAWATFVGGMAVLATGAILVAVGVDDLNTVENASDGTSWSTVQPSYERVPVLTATGFVVLGIGVVGTAIGAALLSVHGEGGTWLEVSAAPGSIRLRGRF